MESDRKSELRILYKNFPIIRTNNQFPLIVDSMSFIRRFDRTIIVQTNAFKSFTIYSPLHR